MKTTAIIAEFNPFHNGHAHLIRHAKEGLSSDLVLIIMSGNFVQRGEPAVFDKFQRTLMALSCGADLVFELPAVFATSAAREFAMASVALADKTGVVDQLLFGTEGIGELSLLSSMADTLLQEAPSYREALQASLRKGESFPLARERALLAAGFSDPGLLSMPNNILASEYLRALKLRHSSIKPLCLLRKGDGYRAQDPSGSPFASATALRRLILSGDSPEALSAYLPECLLPRYRKLLSTPGAAVSPEALSSMLTERLLRLAASGSDFTEFLDVSREIAHRLSRSAEQLMGFSERVESLWTKQYTRSRISRALLHILLGFTKDMAEELKREDYIPYLRLLGFSKAGSALLPALKKNASVPVITRPAPFRQVLATDILASNLYYGLQAGHGSRVPNEYERQIIIL